MDNDIVTSDFERFGQRELAKVSDLLQAYTARKCTKYFNDFWYDEKVKPAFNTHSCYVFLTNEEYQAAMINDDYELDIFESCGECGKEGFPHEFKGESCPGCQQIFKNFEESKA
ncbi:MAG: hypothetical protein ACKO7N_04420 [Candidatus Nitrosotenuis sp.]